MAHIQVSDDTHRMTPSEPGFEAAFARTCRLSHYAARVALAHPEIVADLAGRASQPFARAAMGALLTPGEDLANRIRRLRANVLLTLAHRDLNAMASLDEVVTTVSALADELRAALRRCFAEAHCKHLAHDFEPRVLIEG